MLRFPFVAVLAGLLFPIAPRHAEGAPSLPIIPKPVSIEQSPGTFAISKATTVIAGSGAEDEAGELSRRLQVLAHQPCPLSRGAGGESTIALQLDRSLADKLGTEGYQLSIKPGRILITAPTTAGLFYGGVSLSQLVNADGASIPCAEITDYPRFGWRGMMLDCARHFRSKQFIERFLDLLALRGLTGPPGSAGSSWGALTISGGSHRGVSLEWKGASGSMEPGAMLRREITLRYKVFRRFNSFGVRMLVLCHAK